MRFCKDCGKKITKGSKLGMCQSCAYTHHDPPFKDKQHTEKTKKKIGTKLKECYENPQNHPGYKHGKYTKDYKNYCIDCLEKGIQTTISSLAKRCCKCDGKRKEGEERLESTKKKIRESSIKHHVYGRSYDETIELTRSVHAKMHHGAYFYILEKFGKKGIDSYLTWFYKKYKL